MWISDSERGIILVPKIWIYLGILCFLFPKIEGQCTKPNLSENAALHEDNIQQDSFPEGSSVRLVCDPGYEPASGSPRLKCQSGNWDPNPQSFTCRKKSCGNPGEVKNGRYNMSGGVDFGATVTTICDVGYYLLGDGKRTCSADGLWSGRESVCEVVKCGPPPNAIDNGQLESPPQEEYTYGQVVTYTCKKGYKLFGNGEVRCSQNASWTEVPTCRLVECSRPNIPNGQRIEGNNGPYSDGSILVYKCDEGFKMDGEPRIVCRENGWSPAIPQCKAVPTTSTKPPATTTRPVKESTTTKVSTSSSDKTTPRTSAKATITTEDGRNGAPLVHSSLWMVLATVTVAAQNGLLSMTL